MARASVIGPNLTRTSTMIDNTLPFTCTIEQAQISEGHGEYTIRVSRCSNDTTLSWVTKKRFKDFVDLDTTLKEFNYDFKLPPK
ncbi:unnamed protein product, partial [Didymodactylos carnosus]